MASEAGMPPEQEPKMAVLKAFLAFVQRYAPIDRIRIATMGGMGREAELWQQAGIPGRNGWLIERAHARVRQLLTSGLLYRVTNSLAQFSRVLTAVHGPKAGVDAFHLDLCGTFEAQTPAFRPVLPLIVNGGDVRCLAVTVADSRRNTSLEDFRDVWYRSFRLIGAKHAQKFLAALKAEQRAMPRSKRAAPHQELMNPEKAARREFALFVELSELLRDLAFVPEAMERYAYVSRTSGWPFRMRTYFFRFVPEEANALEHSHMLAERWVASPLSFVTETGAVPVRNLEEIEKEVKGMETPNLQALAALGSPEVKGELEALLAGAKRAEEAEKRAAEAEHELKVFRERVRAALNGAADVVPTAKKLNAVELRSIEAQLLMLRGAAKGAKVLERAKAQARDLLGLKKRKWKPTIGALFARTQGKHRGSFVVRVLRGLNIEETTRRLDELSALYTKIDGKPVNINTLREEAARASA